MQYIKIKPLSVLVPALMLSMTLSLSEEALAANDATGGVGGGKVPTSKTNKAATNAKNNGGTSQRSGTGSNPTPVKDDPQCVLPRNINGGRKKHTDMVARYDATRRTCYYTDNRGNFHQIAYESRNIKHYMHQDHGSKVSSLPRKYVIKSNAGDEGKMQRVAAAQFQKMQDAFKKEHPNLQFGLYSGYRSIRTQSTLSGGRAESLGRKGSASAYDAYKKSAPSGFSEHSTGMAADITSADSTQWQGGSNQYRTLYNWLSKNAHKYGFEQSFSYNTTKTGGASQGIAVEEWHWRFVGLNGEYRKEVAPISFNGTSSDLQRQAPSTESTSYVSQSGGGVGEGYNYSDANAYFKEKGRRPGLTDLTFPNEKLTVAVGRFGEDRGGRFHAGIDFVSRSGGVPLAAGDSGKVISGGWHGGGGNGINIQRNNDGKSPSLQHRFRYLHLQKPTSHKSGSTVAKGAVVGIEGNTGESQGIHLHLDYLVPKSEALNVGLYRNNQHYKVNGVVNNSSANPGMMFTDPTPYLDRDVKLAGKEDVDKAAFKGAPLYAPWLGWTIRHQFNTLFGTKLPTLPGSQGPTKELPKTLLNQINLIVNQGIQMTPEELAAARSSMVAGGIVANNAGFDISGQWVSQPVLASMFLVDDGKDFMTLPPTSRDLQLTDKSPKHIIETIGKARYGNAEWIKAVQGLNSKGMFNEYVQMEAELNFIRERKLELRSRIEALLAALASIEQHAYMKKVTELQTAASAAVIPSIIDMQLEASGDEWKGGAPSGHQCQPGTGIYVNNQTSGGSAATDPNSHIIFGDSNANLAINQTGYSIPNFGTLQGYAGQSVGGADTNEIAGYVEHAAQMGHVRGRTVVLSPGMTNSILNWLVGNGNDVNSMNKALGEYRRQLQALKTGGAAKIYVLSVSETLTPKVGNSATKRAYNNGVTTADINNRMAQIASEFGAVFVRWSGSSSVGDSSIHGYGQTFRTALQKAGLPAQSKAKLIEGTVAIKQRTSEAGVANRKQLAKRVIKQAVQAQSGLSTSTGGSSAASSGNNFIAIGDSIAVGVYDASKQSKIPGSQMTQVVGFAKGGIQSSQVLSYIKDKSSVIKGQNVVLSTGATNDAAGGGVKYAVIEQQLQALKAAGAAKVVVLPVASNLRIRGKNIDATTINSKIKEIATKHGASMAGSWSAGSDGLHASQSAYLSAIKQGGLSGKAVTESTSGLSGGNATTGEFIECVPVSDGSGGTSSASDGYSTGKPGAGFTSQMKEAIRATAAKLNINPNHLAAIIAFESGFRTKAVNPRTGATGLIQFMPNVARELGTSTSALYNMTIEQQMVYVEKYFRQRFASFASLGRHERDVGTLYAMVMGCADIRNNRCYWKDKHKAVFEQNPSWDVDRNGVITMQEAANGGRFKSLRLDYYGIQ